MTGSSALLSQWRSLFGPRSARSSSPVVRGADCPRSWRVRRITGRDVDSKTTARLTPSRHATLTALPDRSIPPGELRRELDCIEDLVLVKAQETMPTRPYRTSGRVDGHSGHQPTSA